jgi:hypothetical protein
MDTKHTGCAGKGALARHGERESEIVPVEHICIYA